MGSTTPISNEHPVLEFNDRMALQSGHSFSFVPIRNILKADFDDHSPYEFHQIEFYVFILYTEGEEVHTIDFKDYSCERGTLLAIRKGQVHKFSKSNVDGCVLVFDFEFLGGFFTETEVHTSLLLFNEFLYDPKIDLSPEQFTDLFTIVNQIQNEVKRVNDSFSASIIRSLLQVLTNKLYRIKSAETNTPLDKKYLADFIRFQNAIEANYTKSLKVRDYAHGLGIHSKTLNNITQSVVNKTAKEFIDEVCINNIKRLLTNTQRSVKEISFLSGFEETSNFNNYFKARTGKTPSQFRKLNS